MAVKIPSEVALSICRKIRDENRGFPASLQALRCRNCEACCNGAVIKSSRDGRACCLVRQRYAMIVAVKV